MKHILFIDPLEKLVVKKDSTLLLAISLQNLGHEVFLLFEKDFYVSNKGINDSYQLYPFKGNFLSDSFYLEDFQLKDPVAMKIHTGDIFHMRLDPPFDTRYLKYLWMQIYLQDRGVKVFNAPKGILYHNEKTYAYGLKGSEYSFIGASIDGFLAYCEELKRQGYEDIILKPLDLYQGIGVEKVSLGLDLKELAKKFQKKTREFEGSVIAQPFIKQVLEGEVRSLYFNGKEIGSILKVPPQGNFLANIAQGATFQKITLNEKQKSSCDKVAAELLKKDTPWIAYDILGDTLSEVNITCPGLLVEVSEAMEKNLAMEIAKELSKS